MVILTYIVLRHDAIEATPRATPRAIPRATPWDNAQYITVLDSEKRGNDVTSNLKVIKQIPKLQATQKTSNSSSENVVEPKLTYLPILKLKRHKKYIPAMIKESDDIISLLPNTGFLSDYKKSFCWYDKTETLRCLPGAYIAGMPKCGTTDLFAKLEWHPNILKPPTGKENMYWPRSRVGRKAGLYLPGHRNKETFDSFTGRMTNIEVKDNHGAIILDGTPILLSDHREWETRYPWATHPPYTNADIIHFVSPQAKVMAMVRDPAERLWSDYLYFDRGEKRTPATFDKHVEVEMDRFQSCLETNDLRYCCFSTENSIQTQLSLGLYICFLQDWRENFGDYLLVITLEEYSQNMVGTLERVFEFLEIQVDVGELNAFLEKSKIENTRQNGDVLKGDMLKQTRQKLQTFYEPYNIMLARYLQDRKFLFGH